MDKNSKSLQVIINHLNDKLTIKMLKDISNAIHAINKNNFINGNGLINGLLTDMFITQYLSKNLSNFQSYHENDSNCKILKKKFNIMKISGKSHIALDWSKNKDKLNKRNFKNNLIIINIKSEQWWKKGPKKPIKDGVVYNKEILSGIYLIDKNYCKKNIKLKSNNKTDRLIDSQYLYLALLESKKNNLYIKLPPPKSQIKFNILKAFENIKI